MASVLPPFGNLLAPGIFQVPTGQLTIDYTHPLANGLMLCLVPGVMGGVDLTGNVPLFTATPASVMGPEGSGLSGGINATTPTANYPQFTTPHEISLYVRGHVFSVSTTFDGWLGVNYNQPITAPFNIFLLGNNATAGQAWMIFNNGGTQTSGATFNYAAGPLSAGGTGSVSGNAMITYHNGLSVGQVAYGTPNATSTSYVTAFGPTVTNGITFYCGYMWNRALTPAEMAWIDADPYAFLVPAEYDLTVGMFVAPPPPPPVVVGLAWSEY